MARVMQRFWSLSKYSENPFFFFFSLSLAIGERYVYLYLLAANYVFHPRIAFESTMATHNKF